MSELAVSKELLPAGVKRGLLALVVLGVALLLAGLATHAKGFYGGLLIGFLFIIDLGLGGALVMAINASAGARWDTVFRQVPLAVAETLFSSAALVLVFVWAVARIYPWAVPGFMDQAIPEIMTKKNWLQVGFFSLRAVAYVAIWVGMLAVILRLYRAQERDGVNRSVIIRKLCMVFCILFAYSYSLASFDWIMSLEPTFYSAIFGVYCFGGTMQCGWAVVTLLVLYLDGKGVFKDQIREQHLHDLGKWIFAFGTFWAYIWFFQFMLVWYADLPDEAQYYTHRYGNRAVLMGVIVFMRFLTPFLFLASQKAKKNRRMLATVAVTVVVGQWLDLSLMVLPSQGGMCNLWAVALPVAAGAGFLLLFFRAFGNKPGMPRQDAAFAYSRRYLT